MKTGAPRQPLGSTLTFQKCSMSRTTSGELPLPATPWRNGIRGPIRALRNNSERHSEQTVVNSRAPRDVAICRPSNNVHCKFSPLIPAGADHAFALPKLSTKAASNDSPDLLSALGLSEEKIEEAQAKEAAILFTRRWVLSRVIVAAAVGTIAAGNSSRAAALEEVGGVVLRTLRDCGLGVAWYPDFVYNAEGGGGLGKTVQLPDGRTSVSFNADDLYIPAVSFGTTTILGFPLPPGLQIEVVPKILQGFVDRRTGQVELDFLANFNFTAGSLYQAAPLVVDARLTTESAHGVSRRGQGRRLDSSGNVKLVAVARLAPVDDQFLRTFLGLPTDCLAELSANLSFV